MYRNCIAFFIIFLMVCSEGLSSEKSEAAKSFELNRYKQKLINTQKYGELILKWERIVGNTACLIYHAKDPMQDVKIWRTKTVNIAFKLVKKNKKWRAVAANVMPGDKVEAYNDWLKLQGCTENK